MKHVLSLIGLLILASCGSAENQVAPDNGLVHRSAGEQTVVMSLRILVEQEEERTVGIVVSNPAQVPIQSIRAWVRFDPETVTVQDLTIADDRFILFAPGERTIDQEEGMIRLGGAVSEPIDDEEILFATFIVRSLDEDTFLTFYDWRTEGDGHTAVLSLSEETVTNILIAPSSLEL